MKKKFVVAAAAAMMSLMCVFPSYAGWEKQGAETWQWKYIHDDGSYTTNNYETINGDIYHFDKDGFLDIGWCKFDGEDTEHLYISQDGADIGKRAVNREFLYGHFDANGLIDYYYYVDPTTGMALKPDGSTIGPVDDWYLNAYRQIIAGCKGEVSTTHYEIPVSQNWHETCPNPFITEMTVDAGNWIGAEFTVNWRINDGILYVDYDIHG